MNTTRLFIALVGLGLCAATSSVAHAVTMQYGFLGAGKHQSTSAAQTQVNQTKSKTKKNDSSASSQQTVATTAKTGKSSKGANSALSFVTRAKKNQKGNVVSEPIPEPVSEPVSEPIPEPALLTSTSSGPIWTELAPTDSPLSIDYEQGQQTLTASVVYSPSPASEIWYFDGNIDGGQSADNILINIATQFGVDPANLTYVAGCDTPTSSCYQATGGTATGLYSNTFLSDIGFTYLAVHFGGGELLFHWDDLVTFFEIGGLPNGLSNYRAYSDVTAVPLPASLPLMLSGLGLLGYFGYRRRGRTA